MKARMPDRRDDLSGIFVLGGTDRVRREMAPLG